MRNMIATTGSKNKVPVGTFPAASNSSFKYWKKQPAELKFCGFRQSNWFETLIKICNLAHTTQKFECWLVGTRTHKFQHEVGHSPRLSSNHTK